MARYLDTAFLLRLGLVRVSTSTRAGLGSARPVLTVGAVSSVADEFSPFPASTSRSSRRSVSRWWADDIKNAGHEISQCLDSPTPQVLLEFTSYCRDTTLTQSHLCLEQSAVHINAANHAVPSHLICRLIRVTTLYLAATLMSLSAPSRTTLYRYTYVSVKVHEVNKNTSMSNKARSSAANRRFRDAAYHMSSSDHPVAGYKP